MVPRPETARHPHDDTGRKDYILASGDSVAIDAVAAKMMGFDPMEIEYIRIAHEEGLGVGQVEKLRSWEKTSKLSTMVLP